MTMAQMSRHGGWSPLESCGTIGALRDRVVVFRHSLTPKDAIQFAIRLNCVTFCLASGRLPRPGARGPETGHGSIFSRWGFGAGTKPGLRRQTIFNHGASDQCRIVNIAPYYNKTTIRNGRRVYITRSTDPVNMAIICKPEAAW